MVNSTVDRSLVFRRLEAAAEGMFDLLFVAPERRNDPAFERYLKSGGPKLVVVDECHCISAHGLDFRPDYRRLGEVRKMVGDVPILALTATATDKVRRDVIESLGMRDPAVIIAGFDRPNLRLEVRDLNRQPIGWGRAGREQLEEIKRDLLVDDLGRLTAGPGSVIVYTGTRRITDSVSQFLRSRFQGRTVIRYHAGMLDREREEGLRTFQEADNPIVVATCAFGMGIDRADVRAVIHWQIPGSLEDYYQEVGRAGRDGGPAVGRLYWHQEDLSLRKFFIESAHPRVQDLANACQWARCMDGKGEVQTNIAEVCDRARVKGDIKIRVVLNQLLDAGILDSLRIQGPTVRVRFGQYTHEEQQRVRSQANNNDRLRREKLRLLSEMERYARGSRCLRERILDYFGDEDGVTVDASRCCSVCRSDD